MFPATKIHRTALVIGMISAIGGIGAVTKVSSKTNPAPVALAAADTNRVALIIANADYPDSNETLKGTLDGARNLAQSLRERGFDVDLEENLSKASMEKAVERLKAKVKPGTAALISFSGFGIQVNHQNYLIPTDARIWNEGDVKRHGSNLTSLLQSLSERGGNVTIAVLDASRRNPFERRFRSISSGLVSVETTRATLVMSTTSPGKTIDGGQDHAIDELAAQMKGPQRDAEALFNATKRRVSSLTKGEQMPTVSSSLVDSFTF